MLFFFQAPQGVDWVHQISNKPVLDLRTFQFTLIPGGTLTAAAPTSVALAYCPYGVNGTDASHWIYVSGGTGTPETVLITGGTCTSGGGGTITFTPANTHAPGWTLSSATAGLQEAMNVCPTSGSCSVVFPFGSVYTLRATATIPSSNVELDCQGSTLTYVGLGDAIRIAPFGTTPPYITGGIKNCLIDGSGNAHTNLSGVHMQSRIGFVFEDVRIANFATAGSSCMTWENIAQGGPSPGFSEQNTIRKADFYNCTKGLRYVNTSGTNSFFYNEVTDLHMTLSDGQIGWSLDGDGTANNLLVFGGSYDFKFNLNSDAVPAKAVALTDAVVERQGYLNVNGEQTSGAAQSYSVYADALSSIYTTGRVNIDNTTSFIGGAQSSVVFTPPLNLTSQSVHYETGGGVSAPRHCKYDLGYPNASPTNGGNAIFWMASFGGTENNCVFQIIKRATDNMNPDVNITGSGAAPVNILYTDALSGKVGIGPGWNSSSPPTFHLDLGKAGITFRTPDSYLCGISKGCHETHTASNSDEVFSVVIPGTGTTVSFSFATPFNSVPTCTTTANTRLISGLGTPNIIIGTEPVIGTAVDHITVNEIPVTFDGTDWVDSTFPFDVTYFVQCKANPS